MAIQFARVEYLSRKKGDNACRLGAYIARSEIYCERTGELFNFVNISDHEYHEVLLPEGVSEKFKDIKVLWNAAEAAEKRVDAQVGKHEVLALPNNKEITKEIRKDMIRKYVMQEYTSKGIGVQLDIHRGDNGEVDNPHAHLQILTRRFHTSGEKLHSHKARDMEPKVRGGVVVEAMRRGRIWAEFQNEYFKNMGLELRVDPLGVVSQNHVGPQRMRAYKSYAIELNKSLKDANSEISSDPSAILNHLFKNEAVVSHEEILRYINKYTKEEEKEAVKNAIFDDKRLLSLYDKDSCSPVGLYTLDSIRKSEEKMVKSAQKILNREGAITLTRANKENALEGTSLSKEQRLAFDKATGKNNLVIIEGVAGSGKSRTLKTIVEAHTDAGYEVLGMAPTAAAANVMKEMGIDDSRTLKSGLLSMESGHYCLNKKTCVVVDEAAMVDNKQMASLLYYVEKSKAKLILVGHDKQLSPVGVGGVFPLLMDANMRIELNDVYRQKGWQKDLSNSLVSGNFGQGVAILKENNAIDFAKDPGESMARVIEDFTASYCSGRSATIISHRRADVMALNNGVRDELRLRGHIIGNDHIVETADGDLPLAVNDLVMLTKNNKALGVFNGDKGTVVDINGQSVTLKMSDESMKKIKFSEYNGFSHGYAVTAHKMQGKTILDSFVFVSGRLDMFLSYVMMTRQKEKLKVYVNAENTKSLDHLVWQLSLNNGNVSSLNYSTLEDILKEKIVDKSAFSELFGKVSEKVSDFFYRPETLYDFEYASSSSIASKATIRKNFIKPRISSELIKEKPIEIQEIPRSHFVKRELYDIKAIREGLRGRSEDLAHSLLSGFKPNESSASELKFKSKNEYSYSVNIEKGVWKEWLSGDGGDMLSLIERLQGKGFKDALSWSNDYLGGGYIDDFNKVEKLTDGNPKQDKIDEVKQKKIVAARRNYDYSKPLAGTLGQIYLKDFRGISQCISKLKDVRFVPNLYRGRNQEPLPAIVSFARNEAGAITGRQAIFLDPETGAKADLEVSKMSLGQVGKGSVVEISPGNKGEPTFVAEGVETALSIEEAGVKGRVICTLGIHNIANIPVKEGEKIVICADNDGDGSRTSKTIDEAVTKLTERGAAVAVVKPEEAGADFNDVLMNEGVLKLRSYFEEIKFMDSSSVKDIGKTIDEDKIKGDNLVSFAKSISTYIKEMKDKEPSASDEKYIDEISTSTAEFILNSTGNLECDKDDIASFSNKSHFEMDSKSFLSEEFSNEIAERVASVQSRLILDSVVERDIHFYDALGEFDRFENDAMQIVEENMNSSNIDYYKEVYGVDNISQELETFLDIYSERYGVLPSDETFKNLENAVEMLLDSNDVRHSELMELLRDSDNPSELLPKISDKLNNEILLECANEILVTGEKISGEKFREIESKVMETAEATIAITEKDINNKEDFAKGHESVINQNKDQHMEI